MACEEPEYSNTIPKLNGANPALVNLHANEAVTHKQAWKYHEPSGLTDNHYWNGELG